MTEKHVHGPGCSHITIDKLVQVCDALREHGFEENDDISVIFEIEGHDIIRYVSHLSAGDSPAGPYLMVTLAEDSVKEVLDSIPKKSKGTLH